MAVTTILTHEVKDFATWKTGFDGDAANREAMGVTISGVYQSTDKPNSVTVISEMPSEEVIKGFLANPDIQAVMENAGVIGVPSVQILNKVG